MTPDPLDDLLERSAPRTVAPGKAEVEAMIAAARAQVPAPRRIPRVALGLGLATLLVGGAGVAAATDGFDWAPWAQDPIAEYPLTLPSGWDCAVRIAHYTSTDGELADSVNHLVEEWWREVDVVGRAAALTPKMIDHIRASGNVMYNADTGENEPAGYGTTWYDADQEYYSAFAQAISELESAYLGEQGIDSDMLGAAALEGGYGIQCLDENGEVAVP